MPALPPRLHKSKPKTRQAGSAELRPNGSKWRSHRLTVLQRYAICPYCLPVVRPSEVVDHIIALTLGGDSADSNLIGACKVCNDLKGKLEQQWSAAGWTLDMLEHAAPVAGTLAYYIKIARAAQMSQVDK